MFFIAGIPECNCSRPSVAGDTPPTRSLAAAGEPGDLPEVSKQLFKCFIRDLVKSQELFSCVSDPHLDYSYGLQKALQVIQQHGLFHSELSLTETRMVTTCTI